MAAFSPPTYPPMAMSLPPVPATLPLPAPVAFSQIENHGQGVAYPGPGLPDGTADLPSTAVTGTSTLWTGHQGALDYSQTSVVQPMFYINHASFRQSLYPPLNTSVAPASANGNRSEQSVPAVNVCVTLASGTGGRDQVGPQRLRRTHARASRASANQPHAKVGAPSSAGQFPTVAQTFHPGQEQENAVEEHRTTWVSP